MIDIFNREISANKMLAVRKYADFKQAFLEQKVGAMLTVENGSALEGSLEKLELLYARGVRALTLTWNGRNELADGVFCEPAGGLTSFGRQVVRKMNELGMMIDVSHLSEQGFWEVLELSGAPVMASHSCAKAVFQHKRNLSDAQIRALVETGGIIGLNLYPAFLCDGEKATLNDCISHIEHMLSLGAENALGLGSDFDGFSGSGVLQLDHPGQYGNLFRALEGSGHSEALLKKLSCGNFLAYAEKILY